MNNLAESIVKTAPAEKFRAAAVGLAVGGGVQWLCYEDVRAFPAAVCVAVILYRIWDRAARVRILQEFEKHFSEFLSTLYSGIMAGSSMENGIRSAAADMERMYGKEDLLVRELREMQKELALRVSSATLFVRLGERSGSEDIRNLGEILLIAEKMGGSPDQTLKACHKTILERMDTKQEIDTVIAGKVFEQRIMSVVPAGILLYLKVSFGGVMDCLYGNAAGALIMTAALALYLSAVLIGERMVRIEV